MIQTNQKYKAQEEQLMQLASDATNVGLVAHASPLGNPSRRQSCLKT
jgi:hypothetical protein